MSLKSATVRAVRGNCVELAFPSEFHKMRVEKGAASMHVASALTKVLGQEVRLTCALAAEDATEGGADVVDLVSATQEVFGK